MLESSDLIQSTIKVCRLDENKLIFKLEKNLFCTNQWITSMIAHQTEPGSLDHLFLFAQKLLFFRQTKNCLMTIVYMTIMGEIFRYKIFAGRKETKSCQPVVISFPGSWRGSWEDIWWIYNIFHSLDLIGWNNMLSWWEKYFGNRNVIY